MGKYDKEVFRELSELHRYCQPYCFVDSPKEMYDRIKQKVLVEVYVPDILTFLECLRKELANRSIADTMIETKISSLRIQKYKSDDLLPLIDRLINYLIDKASPKYPIEDITQSIKEIYINKNSVYGDIWYKRGATGICLDMGRKITRITNGNESIDTIYDLILLCVFLKVFLLYIERIY